MSLLDKVGKLAMDTLDGATRAAEKLQQRVDPLIEKSELASKVRDRIAPKRGGVDDVPEPEQNVSPFETHEDEPEGDKPLANPDLPAQVYGQGTDPWCGRTLQLLADHDVEHEFVDLESEGGLKLESRLMRETGQDSSPYVYLRGELVGGYNALNEIVRLGQIDEMIKPAEERANSGSRTRIVIAKREGDAKAPGEMS